MPQQKKERASNRNLVRWSEALDKKLLLTIQWACNQKNVKIPWDLVGREIAPFVTGGAVVQHLAKLRDRMVMDGLPVPPPLSRGGRVSRANGLLTSTGIEKSRTRKRSKAFKSIEKTKELSPEDEGYDYDIDRLSEGSQEYGETSVIRTKAQGKKRRASHVKKETDSESDISMPKISRKRLRRALVPKDRKENTTVKNVYEMGRNNEAEQQSVSEGEERHAAGAGFWGWDGSTDKGLVILKVGPKLAGSPAVIPRFEHKLSKASSDDYDSNHDSTSLQLSEQTDSNNISPIGYRTYGGQGQVEGDRGNSLDYRMLGEDGFRPQSHVGMNHLTGYHDHRLDIRTPASTSQSQMVPQSATFFNSGNFADSLPSIENVWPGRMEMATTPRHQEVHQLSVPQNHDIFNGASTSPFNGYVMNGGYPFGSGPSNPYMSMNNNFPATPMEPVSQQTSNHNIYGDFVHNQLQFNEPNSSHHEQLLTTEYGLPNRGEWDEFFRLGKDNDGRP